MLTKLTRNPFLTFLPFLLYYVYIILHNRQHGMHGDELRYINFADHLIHGFYSPPWPFVNLWNGPGYPLILTPFAWWHISPLYQALMNAPFLYLAVVFLYRSLCLVCKPAIALTLCVLLAIYPNALAMLALVYTETFTTLLVSMFIYTTLMYYVAGKKNYDLIAGLIFGYLVLTKIIFGYVIIICTIVLAFAFVWKKRAVYAKSIKIFGIAFVITLPYLFYTWHITGRLFYWGNSGGMSLYWMSTPYDDEYGDWKVPDLSNTQYPRSYKSAEADSLLKVHHAKDMAFIKKQTNYIAQDDRYKELAIQNIKQHPVKFIKNCINNISRMLFNFPYSYSFQDAGIGRSIVIGSSIVWAGIIAIIISLLNWRSIAFGIKFLLFATAIYLLLSTVLSAYPRQLDVVVPVLFVWFGYLAQRLNRVNIKFKGSSGLSENQPA
ncbi:hypothetical protein BEL04_20410 [Mucilaginibacter sp. PPCGB 2223]|uniref:glycosyltransferase family 39 protein n=1 Tax=Mucilaginibacter sp. PPCGB 2223 TaxID=1886027 RepID=UPI000824DBC2|nr:glycosyltransferase family 39 protein [Mucilaginibacter sp. PPCGB 2223]OCX51081.1 hypothetical protein BEL04_20410 [Mucilaginibacter sp. PPCGB 2223]